MLSAAPNPFKCFLDKLTSRSALGREEQRAILTLPGRPRMVQASCDLVPLGERADHSCLVVDGLLGRFGQNRDGGRQITAVHVAGDMPDLHCAIAPDAVPALQALAATTVLQVPHSALRHVVRRYPAIAEAFWRECVVDAAIMSEWVVNVGRRNARARAAHFLCEMAWRYEATGERVGFSFPLPVTQTHLADILALTPVHVNRTLRGLRQDGLVDVRQRKVQVLDWRGLNEAGEFDPSYLQIEKTANDNLIRPSALAAQ